MNCLFVCLGFFVVVACFVKFSYQFWFKYVHDFFVFPVAMVEDHFHSQDLYWESQIHLILM